MRGDLALLLLLYEKYIRPWNMIQQQQTSKLIKRNFIQNLIKLFPDSEIFLLS